MQKPLVDAWRSARSLGRRPMQVPGHKLRYLDGAPGWAHEFVGRSVRDDIPLQGGVDDIAYSNGYLISARGPLGRGRWRRPQPLSRRRLLPGEHRRPGHRRGPRRPHRHRPHVAPQHPGGTGAHRRQARVDIPSLHPEFNIPIGVAPESLEGLGEAVNGFFATSPSYVGTLSDVRALAEPWLGATASRSSSTRPGALTSTSCPSGARFNRARTSQSPACTRPSSATPRRP